MSETALLVPGQRGIHITMPLDIVDEDREVAWAGAKDHITIRPDFGFVLGRYAAADIENENGHFFPLDDLVAAYKLIPHTPTNMLHRRQYTVGAFIASEMLYPLTAADEPLGPHSEALSVFWRYPFPREWEAVRAAREEGAAFFSMEAVPSRFTCRDESCAWSGPYRGPMHDSYCEHLRENPVAGRTCHKPHFVGGGIIIPPARPGWKRADLLEVAQLLDTHAEEAGRIYEDLRAAADHLDAEVLEKLTSLFLHVALTRDDFDLVGAITPRPKASKEDANYRASAGEKSCANCAHYQGGACSVVEGDIEPTGVSDLWTAAETDAYGRKKKRKTKDEMADEWLTAAEFAPFAAELDEAALAEYEGEDAKQYNAEQRRELRKQGRAMPDLSFPIDSLADLNNAVQAWGRAPAEKRPALKRYLARHARRLNAGDAVLERIANLTV